MAFVWDLRKSQKHNTIEMPVNARVLATFQGGYNKALGGFCNIHFTMRTYNFSKNQSYMKNWYEDFIFQPNFCS